MWKEATIIPILKNNKEAKLPNSYRPISLLCCLSKIYECFIHTKIRNHCDDNNIIPDFQFGFRPNHSTSHALLKFTEDVSKNLNVSKSTVACSLDCEKAFDTVWTNGLIFKMKFMFGFNNHLTKITYHYLNERNFKVKINSTLSNSFKINAGIPQGSILAPLLYNIYMADLPLPPAYRNKSPKIQLLMYADDIIIYLHTRHIMSASNKISSYLTSLHTFLDLWKIKLNTAKCDAIAITGNNKSITGLDIKVNNSQIHNTKTIEYLGIIFTQNFQFIRHVDKIIKKLRIGYNITKTVLKPSRKLSIKIKIICYKQLLRPIISYAFTSWFNISSHQMERLRVKERQYLRACINYKRKSNSIKTISNKKLYLESKTKRIDVHLIELALNFFYKIENNNNNHLITNCGNFSEQYHENTSHKFKVPHYIKHLNNKKILFNANNHLLYYNKRFSPQQMPYPYVYSIDQ